MSNQNSGASFIGGATNAIPHDPNHVYVQFVNNTTGTSVPKGVFPPVDVSGSASGPGSQSGTYTFTHASGGFPGNGSAPGQFLGAFKLAQTGNPQVFSVVEASPAAVITFSYWNGSNLLLQGTIQFTEFQQPPLPDPPPGPNQDTILRGFGILTPTTDNIGFGMGIVHADFLFGGGERISNLFGTDNVISAKTLTGSITAVPEPSALVLVTLGIAGAATLLRRRA